jgi:hypothetical protein
VCNEWADEVTAFLTLLANERNVSASTQNQAKSALLFLYKQVFGIGLPRLDEIVQATRGTRLAVVLTPREVRQLLGVAQGRMRCEQVQPLTAAPSARPGARRSCSHSSRPQTKTMALNPSRCNAGHGTASAFNRRLQSSLRRCQPQFQLHSAQRQH